MLNVVTKIFDFARVSQEELQVGELLLEIRRLLDQLSQTVCGVHERPYGAHQV